MCPTMSSGADDKDNTSRAAATVPALTQPCKEGDMHRPSQDTIAAMPERERQIADGLRWAQCLLASFGLDSEADVASLVALLAIEWADDDMPAREIRRILQALTETRPVAAHPPSESPEAPLSAVVVGGPTHAA
jgi:hypothetical protein